MAWAVPILMSLAIASIGGMSARLRPVRAVENEPLSIAIEVDDPARAVGSVRIEIRTATGGWSRAQARMDEIEGLWRARFEASKVPRAGSEIAFRATVFGARGGLLLDLGFDEPMTATVESAEVAKVSDRVLRQASTAEASALDRLVAYVGAEGRLGSGARVRAALAVGIAVTPQHEITVGVAVGPAFSRPANLREGGPIVLGFEAGWRGFAIEPRFATLAPFAEAGLQLDLRLPGADPGAVVRAGVSLDLGLDTRLDLSIGGGPAVFGAPAGGETTIGFTGGARLALRFASGGPPR